MFLVTGIGSKTPICTAPFPTCSRGNGFAMRAGGYSNTMPLASWALPSDSAWHDLGAEPYGPRFTHVKCGSLRQLPQSCDRENGVHHETLVGTAIAASEPFKIWSRESSQNVLDISGNPGRIYGGRPGSVNNDIYLYDYNGERVRLSLSGYFPYEYYYTLALPGDAIPNQLGAAPYVKMGQTFIIKNNVYFDPTRLWSRNHWFMITHGFTTPEKGTNYPRWTRTVVTCYCDTSSYTPEASRTTWIKDSFGNPLPFVVEERRETTTFVLEAIQRVRAGRFQIRYRGKSKVESRGYSFPSHYYHEYDQNHAPATTQLLTPVCGRSDSCDLNLDSFIAEEASRLRSHMQTTTVARTSETHTKAIQNVDSLESNWIENLNQGVGSPHDILGPLVRGYAAVKAGDAVTAMKSFASLYLAYKYQVAPNIRDAHDLKNSLVRQLELIAAQPATVRAAKVKYTDKHPFGGSITSTYTTQYHLTPRDSKFSRLWSGLERLGLTVDPANLWDLVPFSFVADWFINIGDLCEQVAAVNNALVTSEVRCRVDGTKFVWTIPHDLLLPYGIISCGELRLVNYHREVHMGLGTFDPIQINLTSSGLTKSQMTQGAALITNYIK